jgi:hypothetical protein
MLACEKPINEKDIKLSKIWSDSVLIIEFLEDDTILFYTDTLCREQPRVLYFNLDFPFQNSQLTSSESEKWLAPLKYNRSKFNLSFEVKVINKNWLLIKNGIMGKEEYLWVPRSESLHYEITSWSDFLIGQDKLTPIVGELTDALKINTNDDASDLQVKAIDCILVISVVENDWLELGIKSFCENESYNQTGYIKWKNGDNYLLVEF